MACSLGTTCIAMSLVGSNLQLHNNVLLVWVIVFVISSLMKRVKPIFFIVYVCISKCLIINSLTERFELEKRLLNICYCFY